jgi:hypothetical protein
MRLSDAVRSLRRRWITLLRKRTVRTDSVGISEPVHRARYFAGGGVVRRCRGCGRPLYGSASLCRSRRCPVYGLKWAADQRQKLFRNLEVLRGEIVLGAVTAPGPQSFRGMRACVAGSGSTSTRASLVAALMGRRLRRGTDEQRSVGGGCIDGRIKTPGSGWGGGLFG